MNETATLHAPNTHEAFYSEHVIKGRKPYVCTFCRAPIAKGEQHVSVSIGGDGGYHSHRAHLACHALATQQTG